MGRVTDYRPVLLGMNNPLSAAAEHAFWPDPAGCSGHRLWQMLAGRMNVSKADFIRRFDRRNVLNTTEWNLPAALAAAPQIWAKLAGRRVVVLGLRAREALGLSCEVGVLEWAVTEDVLWCVAPHPSGRSRYYNDPRARAALALRLETLYSS